MANGHREETGGGGRPETAQASRAEEAELRALAVRLGYEFVDLHGTTVNHVLFSSIPVDLMFRYNFVPLREEEDHLLVAVSDPTDVLALDEVELQLGRPVRVAVGTSQAIQDILKKAEASQRVLDEATEGFRLQVIRDDEEEEDLSIDRLTSDASPIIKLVDSTIFNALQRRASPASRSCPSWTSRRSASPRTAASSSRSRGAPSTSASPSCPPCTGRTR
jgi:hypothetical protein